ncbi:MAG: LacI family DNA-binding transcriptional regulator [Rhodobacteraceae bacterium]|nr:LacI family DNA-binding transcriptional regulator [Paracoccaceae bacterium]
MTSPKAKPTIYDIARLGEASASTVSAVLNGSWRKRRISQTTAERILAIAEAQGYSANLQARGLRRARSGMVGMILPVHDNRFFADMSQSFEAQARQRGLCPVVVSTLRDPAEEARTVGTLIAYAIDSLFIAGATDPAAVGELCRAADLPHVYVDLPGFDAPSVVSDNYLGAATLTETLVRNLAPAGDPLRDRPYFFGGDPGDYATSRRIEAFRATCTAMLGGVDDSQIIARGYAPARAREDIAALLDRIGGLPSALFINALTVFEGVLSHFVTLPAQAFERTVIGCYDYDPFAAFLQFPVHMIRQNSSELIARAFDLIGAEDRGPRVIEIAPELIAPRTIYAGPFGEFG